MTDDLYQEIIIEEYNHPHNRGEMADPSVVVKARNASCGDDVSIALKLKNQQITDVKWQCEGCAISTATMSLLSAKILREGLTVEQVQKLTMHDLEKLLGVAHISPGREKCLLLALSALKKL